MSQGDEQTQILREILKWVRFSAMGELKSTLASALDSDRLKLVYQLSDGTRGTVDLGKLVGMSNSKVFELWQTWLRQGLGETVPVKGGNRFKRTFDIEDFGLKTPQVRQPARESPPEVESAGTGEA